MILAELEVYHSRPVAPTRRVALGRLHLPTDPAPGFGGVLLGGVVARHIGAVDPDLLPDLDVLSRQIELGARIAQPRLRYRFQKDRVGLNRSRHRLHGAGDQVWFEFDGEPGAPTQEVLGAVYAVGTLPLARRRVVMDTIRKGIDWSGPVGPELIAVLSGFRPGPVRGRLAVGDPVAWALEVLGFGDGDGAGDGRGEGEAPVAVGVGGGPGGNGEVRFVPPTRAEVQRRYRTLLMDAHPDRGGARADAAQRIADLGEARRILLG